MTAQELGDHIRRAREIAGYSTEELAAATSIPENAIRAIETGRGQMGVAAKAMTLFEECGGLLRLPKPPRDKARNTLTDFRGYSRSHKVSPYDGNSHDG